MLQHILHQPLGQVIPCRGDKVAGTALTGVHLKHLVLAGAGVVLDVHIGKAFPLHIFQKVFQLFQQGSIIVFGVRQDGRIVADAFGGLLFQQGAAQSHQLDFVVQAAVGVQHTHAVVIAGDILLQNQFVLVAAAVNGGGDGVKFFAVIGKEHLFLVGEGAVPIRRGIARLDDNGERKRQFYIFIVLRIAGCRFGVAQAVCFAGTVKVFLNIQVQHGLQFRAGKVVIGFQGIAVAAHQHGVTVRAGNQHQRLVRMGFCVIGQRFYKRFIVFQIRFQHGNFYKIGVGSCNQRTLADGHAAHAILLVKAACHTINIGIAAKKYR